MELQLNKGYSTVIDDSDYWVVSGLTWYAQINHDGKVYVAASSGHRSVYMHRLIMGIWDSKVQVDHKDSNSLNNRRDNLRLCTKQQNEWNKAAYPRNTSGYKGVTFHKRVGRWSTAIRENGKCKHLGYFDTAYDASLAYAEAAKELHGQFLRLDAHTRTGARIIQTERAS